MKLAVIFIGTNKYLEFLPNWYESCEKHLVKNTEKTYFVFTDGELEGLPENIHHTHHEHQRWPFITLYRWDTILRVKDELQQFDYVLFLDADMRIVDDVTEEELFTDKKYIGVHHPCHFLKMQPHDRFPGAFETNPKSNAFVSKEDDLSTYWQGCMWGGKVPYVIDMIYELDKRTKDDETRDTIAVWHDESHLNKFYVENKKDVHTLGPEFAYPEVFQSFCHFDPKIVHLSKENSSYQV